MPGDRLADRADSVTVLRAVLGARRARAAAAARGSNIEKSESEHAPALFDLLVL